MPHVIDNSVVFQYFPVQWLREANTHLVQAVKGTGQLQENLILYVGSENANIRDVYNQLRIQIAITIRAFEETRFAVGGVKDVLSLDALKPQVKEGRSRINRRMSELVAQRAISPSMAPSLVNDSVFTHDIAINLIRAAQILCATTGKKPRRGSSRRRAGHQRSRPER